ncbi:MAG: hypothetical protein JWP71_1880 [Mucilaginibacter sp.]|nr:hypothetical protein [Mucilaginibacter sp.]
MRQQQPAYILYIFTTRLSFSVRNWSLYSYLLLLLFLPQAILAEGSKELSANGGNRAFLFSSNTGSLAFPFPTFGTMKVYVKAGETLYIGSSAQGIGSGTINLRAPDGNTYTSGTSTTIGLINDRGQELAGPQPNVGGYTPYTRVATAAQAGIWEIDFIGPSNGNDPESNPVAIAANGNWVQPSGQYIAAFDISVRDASNSSFLTGRVFTNIFCGIISAYNGGFNAIMHILTQDGYSYDLDNNGQAGNGFSFFVNNKGFRNGGGKPSYLSINSTNTPNVQDPRAADTQTDITDKIFFNAPAADLPATASTPGGGSTWLINPPFVPSISATSFTGNEGTIGKTGTSPLGGTISFTATSNGSYTITIDVDHNGTFTDAIDRKLTGIVNTGPNQVSWDGLDGLGNKVPASTVSYTTNISLSLYSAEVHFPFFDVERNVNGIKLTRTSGAGSPDYTVYWDDSQLTVSGTPSNPVQNLTGINSLINGHKWGSPTIDPNADIDFGNNKSIDTWSYVTSPPLTATINFIVQEADLEVVNLTSSSTGGCVGQKVNYTVLVKNNGPSDVSGAIFSFTFPNELSGLVVTSTQTAGTASVIAETTTANLYTATLNMTNGATRTFFVTGTVTALPASNDLSVTAAILRPADVTDPDATNPDSAIPSDPLAECNSSPSGTGCNNIQTNILPLLAAPNAGPDQIVEVNTTATLTANTNGTWTQLGITPAIANINAPASTTTTITGLTTIGIYNFIFTNANGCADTVAVKAITANLSTPNIFTPNGDGQNDVYEIAGITLYPGSQFLVYNRWGNEVYRSENYANTWDGKGLAEGTYFYILNRKEKTGAFTTFKGWIYLKR